MDLPQWQAATEGLVQKRKQAWEEMSRPRAGPELMKPAPTMQLITHQGQRSDAGPSQEPVPALGGMGPPPQAETPAVLAGTHINTLIDVLTRMYTVEVLREQNSLMPCCPGDEQAKQLVIQDSYRRLEFVQDTQHKLEDMIEWIEDHKMPSSPEPTLRETTILRVILWWMGDRSSRRFVAQSPSKL